tara:strand:- start:87 stop:788 length:702 start_codon:yes stop_codon:yes gene_type:complete
MISSIRVVSLVPSVTETLLAWGIEPIACTRFCEQPGIAHVGGTKDPDLVGIKALAPDLVVFDQEENRLEDYQELASHNLKVESLHVTSVSDVGTELGRLASIVGAQWSYSLDVPRKSRGLKAFVPIWRRPWMTVTTGTYGVSLLNHLGVDVVFSENEELYPTLDDEALLKSEPDIVLAPSEPYPFGKRHIDVLEAIAPTLLIDGQDLFWWGSRTVQAIQRLDRQLEAFDEKGL